MPAFIRSNIPKNFTSATQNVLGRTCKVTEAIQNVLGRTCKVAGAIQNVLGRTCKVAGAIQNVLSRTCKVKVSFGFKSLVVITDETSVIPTLTSF